MPPHQTRPAPPGGRRAQIVAEARSLLEAEGPEGLSMRRLAERIGVRAPSLYKHIPDKAALEAELVADGVRELADLMDRVAPDLGAFAQSYRWFADEHPHLYRLMFAAPAPDAGAVGLPERVAEPLLAAVEGDVDRARAVWALVHGMVELGRAGLVPAGGAEADAAWDAGVAAFDE